MERFLTHQHCAHRSRNQNWVVNPEWKRQNPGSGWERNHADSKKGGRGLNVSDYTCSKNWDTEKNQNQISLGISLPLESGQLERWCFHLGASNGISVIEIAALSPLQKADEVLTRSSKPIVRETGSDGFWQQGLGSPCSSWPHSYASYSRQNFTHAAFI